MTWNSAGQTLFPASVLFTKLVPVIAAVRSTREERFTPPVIDAFPVTTMPFAKVLLPWIVWLDDRSTKFWVELPVPPLDTGMMPETFAAVPAVVAFDTVP